MDNKKPIMYTKGELGRNLREKNVFVRVKGDDGGGM